MTESALRDKYIRSLVEANTAGRAWFDCKVSLVMWPGKPADFETVALAKFKCHTFATHLEAGIFLEMHKPGWAYLVACRRTVFDLMHLERP